MTENQQDYSVFAVFVVAVAGLIIALAQAITPSDEQNRFMAQNSMSENDFMRLSCQMKKACDDYKEVRKSCANAGNISECIKIRAEKESRLLCEEDGDYSFPKLVMPSGVQCLKNSVVSIIKPN